MHDLSNIEGLRKACEEAEAEYANPEWRKQILHLLKYIGETSLEERKSEEFHHRIWYENPISGAGKGEINVDQAISQMEFRSWLAEESTNTLPDDPQVRPDALERIRRDLVRRVRGSGVNIRPWAMVARVLAALFPRDFTTLVVDGFLDSVLKKMGIRPAKNVAGRHRQILDRLQEALGPVPDSDLEQLTHRMTLPWMLRGLPEQDKSTTEPKSTEEADERISSLTEETAVSEAVIPQSIILYGPPGTGKTYSTTQRALELLGEGNIDGRESKELKDLFRKYQEKGQIEFVTFHQSYGYEEFVEGLRPVLNGDEGSDVRYELHDGIFKRIALRAAVEGLPEPEEGSDFDGLWDRLVAEIREDGERVVKKQLWEVLCS